jgi:hypothetical protein
VLISPVAHHTDFEPIDSDCEERDGASDGLISRHSARRSVYQHGDYYARRNVANEAMSISEEPDRDTALALLAQSLRPAGLPNQPSAQTNGPMKSAPKVGTFELDIAPSTKLKPDSR